MKLVHCMTAFAVLVAAINAEESKKSDSIRVLIAMEQTDFKKKLVNKMKLLLGQQGMKTTIVQNSEKELQPFKASDYDLVFITNSGVMSKVRPWIKEWIDNNRADSAKILLHTTKKLKWQEDVYVDAVSSASSNKMVPELAKEYVKKLVDKQ